MVAAVLVAAVVVGGVVFLGSDDDDDTVADDRASSSSPSEDPESPSSDAPDGPDLPEDDPTDGFPSDEPTEDDVPDGGDPGDGTDVPVPPFLLQVGDCYDRSDDEGQVERRDCESAHEAEVVSRKRLTGSYDTDTEVQEKAESLCETSLDSKAKEQPSGTVGGTLVSYPRAEGLDSGINWVTCALTAGKGKKLHKPLD